MIYRTNWIFSFSLGSLVFLFLSFGVIILNRCTKVYQIARVQGFLSIDYIRTKGDGKILLFIVLQVQFCFDPTIKFTRIMWFTICLHCYIVKGFKSWRDPINGSWYIQVLCKTLETHWEQFDLMKILTITAREIATEYESYHDNVHERGQKQIPTLISMLTREIIFSKKNT